MDYFSKRSTLNVRKICLKISFFFCFCFFVRSWQARIHIGRFSRRSISPTVFQMGFHACKQKLLFFSLFSFKANKTLTSKTRFCSTMGQKVLVSDRFLDQKRSWIQRRNCGWKQNIHSVNRVCEPLDCERNSCLKKMYYLVNFSNRTISRPMDGKVTRGKACILLLIIWAYVLPWATLPLLEVWGRFVPGKCNYKETARSVRLRFNCSLLSCL